MERKDNDPTDVTRQLAPLVEDDAYITGLSKGTAPEGDELAQVLLALRDDVETQMPPAPKVEGADEDAAVIPMAGRRRRSRPWVHGLIGAAAATVLIAGVGVTYLGVSADDSDPSDPTVVELAGTLDEIEHHAADGDMESTRALVEEARRLVANMENRRPAESSPGTVTERSVARSTVTLTESPAPAEETEPAPEPTAAPPAPETATVTAEPSTVTQVQTQTQTATATATVTVTQQVPVQPNPQPTQSAEPTSPAPTQGATETSPSPQGQ